jgi:hypothetical protein
VSAVRDAFTRGRGHFGGPARPGIGPTSAFQNGAAWVARVLVPAIEQGNAELEPERAAFRLDLNLDPHSTNHAHAEFWLAELDGRRAQGQMSSAGIRCGCTSRASLKGHSARLQSAARTWSGTCSAAQRKNLERRSVDRGTLGHSGRPKHEGCTST